MALILQLETATTCCSAAIAHDGKCIALKERNEPNIHAASITLFIEEVMRSAGRTMTDLDAVCISKGPGSYTGLRIGVSTAKGLCYALDIPLISVTTLQAMAASLAGQYPGSLLCPMIDARRMEVYTAVYTPQLTEIEPVQAKILDEHSFDNLLATHQLVFFGDGAPKYRQVLHHEQATFLDDFTNSAAHLSALAYKKFQHQAFEDVAYFEPYYLKEFLVTVSR